MPHVEVPSAEFKVSSAAYLLAVERSVFLNSLLYGGSFFTVKGCIIG